MFKHVNDDIYRDEWQWQEGEYTVTRTAHWSAPGCHDSCGLLLYTKDGKLCKVEGDPKSPYNNGRLCMRCLNLPEAVNHPDRLKWPLKRVGERGENKWERITWDEAYDIIEQKVRAIWRDYGPESIVGLMGTGRNCNWQVPYITYRAFRSPNFALGFLSGDSCMLPRHSIAAIVMGDLPVMDASQFRPTRYDDPEYVVPEVIFVIGNNPIKSNPDGFLGHWIVDLMQRGSKLIVVDPQLTWLASRADIWLQVRPGTDTAVILAIIRTIIKEDLYDHEFVEKWCYGLDKLAEAVEEWTPEKVAEITWVPADLIVKAARMYAKAKPGALQWGLATDMNINGIPQAHALMCMNAILGNIEKPGSNVCAREAYNICLAYPFGYEQCLSEEMRAKRLGSDESPMHSFGLAASAPGDAVLRAIETGKPYPIRMLWMQSTNPITNMAGEAPRVYRAIRKVDFNVVVDVFMTPTAVACADLVLPAAMSCERNSIRLWWTPIRAITKVTSYYEAKSDEEIMTDLCHRLSDFPYTKDTETLNWILQGPDNPFDVRTPFTWEELKEKVQIWPEHQYYKHEKGLLRPDGQPGFNTPTGKIELYSTILEMLGEPPLPYYQEPPESPVSTPDLYEQFPLVLTTGHRSWEFFHSEHRQQKTMREFHPWPLVDIHPDTAAKYGIKDGDWVWIEGVRGRCRQIANLTETIDPRVINAEHGWWFPEANAENLFDTFDCNINNLTTQCVVGSSGYGAPYKGLLCRIYKCTEENSRVQPTEQVTKLGGFEYVR